MSDDVLDLDAIEVTEIVFRFGGRDYRAPGNPTVRAVKAYIDGDILACLEAQVGADQWAQIVASPEVFTVEHAQALLGRIISGESSASTDSSLPIPEP